MSLTWRGQAERGTAAGVRLILWVALLLGRGPARALLLPIAFYFFATAREQREASRCYLARVRGRPARWWEIVHHMHVFASTILDRVFVVSGRTRGLDIRRFGVDLLDRQVATGRGALLLGSHLGTFEALRALADERGGIPFRMLMVRDHNATMMRVFESLNPRAAEDIIEMGFADSMLKVGRSLEEGFLVGILADRVAGPRKVTRCRMLNSVIELPTGPILLADSFAVPVLMFFGLYRGGNRYDVHVELLADRIALDPQRRAAQVQEWMQRFADRLAHHACAAPYNWFNFYDLWHDELVQRG